MKPFCGIRRILVKNFKTKTMKSLLTLICALILSVVGMGQTTYITSTEIVDVVNPYSYLCDDTDYFPLGGWPANTWEEPEYQTAGCPFDCVLSSTVIEVPAATELDSLYLHVTNNQMLAFDEEFGFENEWTGVNAYSWWSLQTFGSEPALWGMAYWIQNDDRYFPGIEIINLYSGQKVYFKKRPEFANFTIVDAGNEEEGAVLEGWVGINIDLTNDEEDVNLGPGLYEVRIIKQVDELDMWWEPGVGVWWYGDMNQETYVGWPDLPLNLPVYNQFSDGANNGTPDFEFDSIKYAINELPGAPITWNPPADFEFCEGIEFTIDGRYGPGGNMVPCTENPDYTYYWQLQSGNSWPVVGMGCEYTETLPAGEYNMRLKTVYLEGTEDEVETINDEFLVIINPAPEWDYGIAVDPLYNVIEDCELWFGVEAFNTTENVYESETYMWVENEDFGTNLIVDAVDTEEGSGFVANFCFDPFTIETDTVGSFFVTSEVIFEDYYGCSVLDTTYVVYLDSDTIPGWSGGDSLDFRNFIIIDTTVVDTSTFVTELLQRQVQLYPNPTNGLTTIEHNFDVGSTLEVYGLTGTLVRREMVTQKKIVTDFADLPKGIYLVTIFDEQDRFTLRLVKQ